VIDFLAKKGIMTSVHFIPLHVHPFYKNKYGYQSRDFMTAYNAYLGTVTLPFFPSITAAQQAHVADCLKTFIH